jgi:hypothetical protein
MNSFKNRSETLVVLTNQSTTVTLFLQCEQLANASTVSKIPVMDLSDPPRVLTIKHVVADASAERAASQPSLF